MLRVPLSLSFACVLVQLGGRRLLGGAFRFRVWCQDSSVLLRTCRALKATAVQKLAKIPLLLYRTFQSLLCFHLLVFCSLHRSRIIWLVVGNIAPWHPGCRLPVPSSDRYSNGIYPIRVVVIAAEWPAHHGFAAHPYQPHRPRHCCAAGRRARTTRCSGSGMEAGLGIRKCGGRSADALSPLFPTIRGLGASVTRHL
ncbi:hypothetical protein F4780DRAFT_725179 [Xylariomycetidae sp. FL0641]|nr:hypothetical protein F4780DRAFT_725179 [Xylariomycetidae sp. FL0641]